MPNSTFILAFVIAPALATALGGLAYLSHAYWLKRELERERDERSPETKDWDIT